jgi:hypothetical protein
MLSFVYCSDRFLFAVACSTEHTTRSNEHNTTSNIKRDEMCTITKSNCYTKTTINLSEQVRARRKTGKKYMI